MILEFAAAISEVAVVSQEAVPDGIKIDDALFVAVVAKLIAFEILMIADEQRKAAAGVLAVAVGRSVVVLVHL